MKSASRKIGNTWNFTVFPKHTSHGDRNQRDSHQQPSTHSHPWVPPQEITGQKMCHGNGKRSERLQKNKSTSTKDKSFHI